MNKAAQIGLALMAGGLANSRFGDSMSVGRTFVIKNGRALRTHAALKFGEHAADGARNKSHAAAEPWARVSRLVWREGCHRAGPTKLFTYT